MFPSVPDIKALDKQTGRHTDRQTDRQKAERTEKTKWYYKVSSGLKNQTFFILWSYFNFTII